MWIWAVSVNWTKTQLDSLHSEVLRVVWALMMQWACVKLKKRAGGSQDLNEKSPLPGEKRSPACDSGQFADSETSGFWGDLILHCFCTLQSFRALQNVYATTAFKFTGVPTRVGTCAWRWMCLALGCLAAVSLSCLSPPEAIELPWRGTVLCTGVVLTVCIAVNGGSVHAHIFLFKETE